MALQTILVLSLVVAAFAVFGAVLLAVTFYERSGARNGANRRAAGD